MLIKVMFLTVAISMSPPTAYERVFDMARATPEGSFGNFGQDDVGGRNSMTGRSKSGDNRDGGDKNKKKKPKILQPIPTPPIHPMPDPAVIEAKKRERDASLKRRGRASTIITGGSGVLNPASLSRPSALGG